MYKGTEFPWHNAKREGTRDQILRAARGQKRALSVVCWFRVRTRPEILDVKGRQATFDNEMVDILKVYYSFHSCMDQAVRHQKPTNVTAPPLFITLRSETKSPRLVIRRQRINNLPGSLTQPSWPPARSPNWRVFLFLLAEDT
jgi:hypothetical protein